MDSGQGNVYSKPAAVLSNAFSNTAEFCIVQRLDGL